MSAARPQGIPSWQYHRPAEITHKFPGRPEIISNAPSLPADLPQSSPAGDPVYVALAQIPAVLNGLDGPNGQALALRPGMLAEALVPVERRRVIEWLFEPLLRGFNQGAGRAPQAGAR